MKLLLDTHIWLWSLLEEHRLSARVLQELHSPNNEIWLSPINTWEALTLHQKKRLYLQDDLDVWVAEATRPFLQAPLTHQIAAVARKLPLPHRDPAA